MGEVIQFRRKWLALVTSDLGDRWAKLHLPILANGRDAGSIADLFVSDLISFPKTDGPLDPDGAA